MGGRSVIYLCILSAFWANRKANAFRFLTMLQRLVDAGKTVLVVEHSRCGMLPWACLAWAAYHAALPLREGSERSECVRGYHAG